MELINKNLTCIFDNFAKDEIDEAAIRYQLQLKLEEKSGGLSLPDPIAPIIISFPNNKVEISFFENKLSVNCGNNNIGFTQIVKMVLENCGNLKLGGYGFNFNWINNNISNICSIFDITFKVDSKYKNTNNSTLAFSFTDNSSRVYNIDFSDNNNKIAVHSNVHYNEKPIINALSASIGNKYEEALSSSIELIEEVLDR